MVALGIAGVELAVLVALGIAGTELAVVMTIHIILSPNLVLQIFISLFDLFVIALPSSDHF